MIAAHELSCFPCRIVIHDYSGHSFPAQLARWLACQGNTVLHLYSGDVETPRGRLKLGDGDPATLIIEGVSTGKPLAKYKLMTRWFQELDYGSRLGQRIMAFKPDVVLSANASPPIQARLLKTLRRADIPMVFWVQDLYSLGVAEVLKKVPLPVRWLILRFLERMEFGTIRQSSGIVVISNGFLQVLASRGITHPISAVIENWASTKDLRPQDKVNPWAMIHGITGKFVFLYAGTMGIKHNPVHLANLARAFRDDPEVRVVVISQGSGRQYLEAVRAAETLDNLVLMDYQPFEQLSEVLSSADVSVLLLEKFASVWSVPSKVYSYLCVGRPVLGAISSDNLACQIVEQEKVGLCVASDDEIGFIHGARRLRHDATLRAEMARKQTSYASRVFDIDLIGARFLAVIDRAIQRG